MPKMQKSFKGLLLVSALSLAVMGCEGVNVSKTELPNDRWDQREARKSVFGEGLTFGGEKDKQGATGGTGIGVNAYLWRASLDTISFMPLASADPFGGVILTDWHSDPNAPQERFKLNVYILGQALRADGIRVAAFRQARAQDGEWRNLDMDPKAIVDIENAILTRARQLRSDSMAE